MLHRSACLVHCAHPVPSGAMDLQSMDVYFFYFHFRRHTHVPRVGTLSYWLGCMHGLPCRKGREGRVEYLHTHTHTHTPRFMVAEVERVERSRSISISTAYGRQAGRNSVSGLYQASMLIVILVPCPLSLGLRRRSPCLSFRANRSTTLCLGRCKGGTG